jgi:hypothetical protein
MKFDIKTEGFKELDEILKTMPDNLAKKALKKSVADGIRVIRDQAAVNVGKPKSAFSVSAKLNKKTGYMAQALLGLSKKSWALLFKETGTKLHKIEAGKATARRIARYAKKGRTYTGGQPARILADKGKGIVFGKSVEVSQAAKPFLAPAFDSKYEAALGKMKEVLGEQIDKLWKGTA